jgi:hypothetical protein
MRIGQIIPLTFIMSFLACDSKNTETSIQIPPRSIQTDTTDGRQFIAIIKNSDANNSILLTKMDLETINQQLKIAVRDYNIQREEYLKKLKIEDPTTTLRLDDLVIDLKNYKRQYVAYLNSKKQKEVWVNCFCSNRDSPEWKFKRVQVEDGGKCYFNLKIMLEQKTYSEFSVNGRA